MCARVQKKMSTSQSDQDSTRQYIPTVKTQQLSLTDLETFRIVGFIQKVMLFFFSPETLKVYLQEMYLLRKPDLEKAADFLKAIPRTGAPHPLVAVNSWQGLSNRKGKRQHTPILSVQGIGAACQLPSRSGSRLRPSQSSQHRQPSPEPCARLTSSQVFKSRARVLRLPPLP